MAISYDKKIMECVLRSVMSEGNVAQGKAIKSICKSPKPLFITGKGGSGKAQPLYAKILTPDGFKNMGDIKVGDKVMGADGKQQTVLGVYPQGIRPVYKVTMNDGYFTYCDEEHLWSYRLSSHYGKTPFSRCSTLKEIISTGIRKNVKIKNGEKQPLRYEIPVCRPIEYEEKKFSIHPYVLGVLIGDGSLNGNMAIFSCSDSDVEIRNRVESFLGEDFLLSKKKEHPAITCPQYSVIQKNHTKGGGFINRIKDLGLNVTSGYKFIPEEYKLGSIDQRMHLLNGLMDTDGTCSKERNRLTYSTTSKRLAEDIVDLVQSLGGIAKINTLFRPDKKYVYEYTVRIKMYDNVFTLKRKKERYVPNPARVSRYIESVEKVDDSECVCIKVSNKDELYITDNYIVTHNTTFLKRIIPALKNAVVVAPTGVAAVNAGGQTIHSFFRIGMQPYIPEIRKGAFMDNCEYKFNGGSEKILQNIKYLIIDEISMVRPDLLDNVADILRHARGDKDPFGGVKLIMVGDLFQLPPVIKEDFFREIYDTSYFFSSKSLMASGMEMVSFEKIYRQKDEKFISVLNKVREGQMDDDVFDTINSRCIQSDNNQGYVEIVTTNSKATAINEMRISSLPGSLRKLEAVINGDYPKDAPVEKTLFLKEGSRVMITRNGGEYFNGSLGTVLSIKKGEIEVVLDKPKDDDHTKVVITPCSFEKVKYVRNGYKIESEVVGAIIQYPIKIGYSITIHKAQGLTLDAAMMDVSNSFETGQLYTALSRVKSLDGLYLRQPIPKTVKTSDQVVINFYKRTLGNGGIVKPVPMEELEKSMINLSTGSEIDFAEFNL